MNFRSNFPSSPNVGPAKRSFSDELQDSPTAKRAKRARPNKKDRTKGPKGAKDDSNGSVEQKARASSDHIPGIDIPRKETPINPPISFPLKEIPKIHVPKAAEKALKKERKKNRLKKNELESNELNKNESNDNEVKKNESKAKKDAKNGAEYLAAQDTPKTQANTRKTRAEPNNEPKYPINNGTSEIPAIAGPSKTKTSKQKPAYESKELTPISNFTPTRDYTFKAYPNPLPAITQPPKQPKSPNPNGTNAAKLPPNTDISPPSSPPLVPALATPSGTKTLKAINKQLRALSSHFSPTTSSPSNNPHQDKQQQQQQQQQQATEHAAAATQEEIARLRADITRLHERLDRDGLRAAARHTMLFNALVKVAGDVGAVAGEVRALGCGDGGNTMLGDGVSGGGNGGGGDGEGGGGVGTPRAGSAATAKEVREKLSRSMLQSRKTLEQCLGIYTEDMERAGTREEVVKYAGLAVQYAGDLFKTLG
ncbi:hypothetical protein B0I37DRAFT_430429 [Chaetomium sp. MPI-CAGE-AT-0009]|nr:hypothetical protein B0I37DRAFT_430429 [Chaetomium sp. MPI-CAGE-AT-0009]